MVMVIFNISIAIALIFAITISGGEAQALGVVLFVEMSQVVIRTTEKTDFS